jgi:uncharacterized protein YoxC
MNGNHNLELAIGSFSIIGLIVVAVKLSAQVKEIQKDLDHLQSSLEKRDTYVECVKLRAEVDQLESQVSALWDYTNKLRDKFNGH